MKWKKKIILVNSRNTHWCFFFSGLFILLFIRCASSIIFRLMSANRVRASERNRQTTNCRWFIERISFSAVFFFSFQILCISFVQFIRINCFFEVFTKRDVLCKERARSTSKYCIELIECERKTERKIIERRSWEKTTKRPSKREKNELIFQNCFFFFFDSTICSLLTLPVLTFAIVWPHI